MQIKISARRYISELGLTQRKWINSDVSMELQLVIIENSKNDFSLSVAIFIPHHGWAMADNDGWKPADKTIVCWSEIKI